MNNSSLNSTTRMIHLTVVRMCAACHRGANIMVCRIGETQVVAVQREVSVAIGAANFLQIDGGVDCVQVPHRLCSNSGWRRWRGSCRSSVIHHCTRTLNLPLNAASSMSRNRAWKSSNSCNNRSLSDGWKEPTLSAIDSSGLAAPKLRVAPDWKCRSIRW